MPKVSAQAKCGESKLVHYEGKVEHTRLCNILEVPHDATFKLVTDDNDDFMWLSVKWKEEVEES